MPATPSPTPSRRSGASLPQLRDPARLRGLVHSHPRPCLPPLGSGGAAGSGFGRSRSTGARPSGPRPRDQPTQWRAGSRWSGPSTDSTPTPGRSSCSTTSTGAAAGRDRGRARRPGRDRQVAAARRARGARAGARAGDTDDARPTTTSGRCSRPGRAGRPWAGRRRRPCSRRRALARPPSLDRRGVALGCPLGPACRGSLAGLASLAAVALVAVLVGLPLTARPPASEAPTAAASGVLGATGPPASPNAEPASGGTGPHGGGARFACRGPRLGARRPRWSRSKANSSARSLGAVPGRNDLRGTRSSPGPAPRSSSSRSATSGPGPGTGSGPKAGTFALRLTDSRDATGERLIVEYLGDILPAADRLAWSVDDLAAGEAREGGGRDWAVFKGYVAVRGWLVRTPLQSCPSIARAPANGLVGSGPVYGCPTDDWLTSAEVPAASGRRVVASAPRPGSTCRAGPTISGRRSRRRSELGVEPREATFLLAWRAVAPCGPLADCFDRPGALPLADAGSSRPDSAGGRGASRRARDRRRATTPAGFPSRSTASRCCVGLDTQRRLAEATDDTPFLAGGFSWSWADHLLGWDRPDATRTHSAPRHVRGTTSPGMPGRLFVPSGRDRRRRRTSRRPGPYPGCRRGETCWPHLIEWCRSTVVLDAVAWHGRRQPRGRAPFGPREAIGRVLSILFAERREVADRHDVLRRRAALRDADQLRGALADAPLRGPRRSAARACSRCSGTRPSGSRSRPRQRRRPAKRASKSADRTARPAAVDRPGQHPRPRLCRRRDGLVDHV